MDVNIARPLALPLALLGGLSPSAFMARHWQKKPLLVRQAWPQVVPPVTREALFALAADDAVESRLVQQRGGAWSVRSGPLARRSLPPPRRPGWTLLVQGLDLHVPAAHEMLARFRFVPDARLDDLMVSWASSGGGVGPHVDSYDVFLLQVQGRRRWRVGRVPKPRFVAGAPLKLLAEFTPAHEWLLEPGDMLYLPPGWGHDGVADGSDCMTCSIGFRAPAEGELARELLLRLADDDDTAGRLYADRRQPATATPAALPPDLLAFADSAVRRRLAADPHALARVLGEWLTEPKPNLWFAAPRGRPRGGGLRLAARTRMLYDARHVFVNGEAFRASGADARLLRGLADRRELAAAQRQRLSPQARALVTEWLAAGWLHEEEAR